MWGGAAGHTPLSQQSAAPSTAHHVNVGEREKPQPALLPADLEPGFPQRCKHAAEGPGLRDHLPPLLAPLARLNVVGAGVGRRDQNLGG